jgi:RNA-directed DNA polymerase
MLKKQYKSINWKQCHLELLNHQHEILKAFRLGNKRLVLQLQNRLAMSFAARALAVRKITSNKGKNTPGIDNVILDTDELKLECINNLKYLKDYVALPVKRIYIAKEDGSRRPLGIPTCFDRAVQTLYSFALDPIVEEISCERAYGFRIGRSLHDCATYLFLALAQIFAPRRYILCADISKFFDTVSHEWLINNVPIEGRLLKQFLKAGFIDADIKHPTYQGFPQGSPISPALANYALAGLQKHLGEEYLSTRFADDFLVLGKTIKTLETTCMSLIKEFLGLRGLKLNLEKTKIVHISQGFDFLGLNFREYPDETRVKGTKQGAFLIKPKKSKVNEFIKGLTALVKSYKTSNNYQSLIVKLNQKLRGFANHYRKYISKTIFSTINFRLSNTIYRMIKNKHRGRNATWLHNRFFCRVNKNNWNFCYKRNDKVVITLFNIASVPIKRHQLRSLGNPFDPVNYAGFRSRTKILANQSVTTSKTKSTLLTKQKGYCPICDMPLQNEEDLNIHHIYPINRGGTNRIDNLLLLHKVCHVQLEYSRDKNLQATFAKESLKVK